MSRLANAPPRARLAGIGRLLSRISIRLLAFNILLVFLPAVAILTLESFEQQLLAAQERAMVQQGRILAAALAGRGPLDGAEAGRILVNLKQRQANRLRVVAPDGSVLADSSRLGPRRETADVRDAAAPRARERLSYRIGLFFYRLFEGALHWPSSPQSATPEDDEPSNASVRVLTPEVRQALSGRYGSASRPATSSRSLLMISALPIENDGAVVGAVVVSRSTFRILQALYDFRTRTVEVIFLSLAVAAVLSLLVSTTIARPLRRIKRDANAILDRRGRLRRPFEPLARWDEIGDLSRALAELTRRLEDHQGFMESFASDLSHEFKNPLAAIRGVLDVLPTVDEPAAREHFLDMAQADVARLEKLLTSVREIALIDSHLDRQSDEAVPLQHLARAAVERRQLDAGEGPRFVLHTSDKALEVMASPLHLSQVIDNLLDNASGFAPDASDIEVTLSRRADRVRLRVADRGAGFPDGNHERVFDRFYSDRPGSAKGTHGHAGLGLAIVKAIVEGYGGRVWAANRDGGGAELTVELPAAPLAPTRSRGSARTLPAEGS